MLERLRHNPAVVFALFWTVAVAYLAVRAESGWIPHDEGFLGHTAERMLAGELPHRDFDDTYTGGLGLLHAAAFLVFGIELSALRWMLLLFSALAVAALFAIARRFAGPWTAGWVTWVAVAWSLPIYFAAMPSWYNLFFAIFGTLALLRFLEDDRRRWLVAAGLCGGASCLMKSTGLFFVAAALLFLVYREQELAATAGGLSRPGRGRAAGFRLATAAALAIFCVLLVAIVPKRMMELLHFAAPGVGLCLFLLARERQLTSDAGGERWRRLLGLTLPFLAGVALPIAIFLVPYAASGSLDDLNRGLAVLPRKLLGLVASPLPPPATLLAVLPMAALLLLDERRFKPLRRGVLVAGTAAAAALVVALGDRDTVYRAVWYSARPLVPAAVLAGLLLLERRHLSLDAGRRQRLFLLLAMASLVSLVQVHFAFGTYFAHTAPVVALALLAVVSCQPAPPRRLLAVALGFYLIFALTWLHHGWVQAMGVKHWPVAYDAPLNVDRGGLKVQSELAPAYERLVAEVQRHSAAGAFIYATPDCPQVYFLAERRNPTRTLFDFFDDDYFDGPARGERLLALLDARDVDVVVFNRSPQFSDRISANLVQGVFTRFPHRLDVPPFSVHWRERP